MKAIKDLISEVFQENLWEAECVLRSDRKKNITKVTDNLRAVCGLTVVTVQEPAQDINDTVERTVLRVKFFKSVPGPLRNQLKKMSIDARKIDGVFSFIPKNAKQVVSRIYRPTSSRMVAQEE